MDHSPEETPEELGAMDTPTGRHATPPGTAAVLVILLALALSASVLRTCGGPGEGPRVEDVDLSVPDWRPNAAEQAVLEAVQAARREASPPVDDPHAVALLEAFERFNRTELAHLGAPRHPEVADAHADYAQWAQTAFTRLGAEAFIGLGQRLFDGLRVALEAGDEATVARLAGTFVDQSRATGLLPPKSAPDVAPSQAFAVAWMAHRWLVAVRDLRPQSTLLAPEERELVARWKLAAHTGLPPTRRLELARELETMGSTFPVLEALAARAAQDADWARAAELYRVAAAQGGDVARLEANAAYAVARSRPRRP